MDEPWKHHAKLKRLVNKGTSHDVTRVPKSQRKWNCTLENGEFLYKEKYDQETISAKAKITTKP